jgi:hypothetical protein
MPDGSIDQERSGARIVTAFSENASGAVPAAEMSPRVRREAPPSVNIRITLPVLKSRFYFAVVGGRERRSRERLAVERRYNRIATRSNILFIVIGAFTLYMVTLGAFLLYAAATGT